ncbi:MAG: MFS transporter [Alphaproteobacteria bacterium]|nr:MFS transporter [Alphaproteobacteria bacterium]
MSQASSPAGQTGRQHLSFAALRHPACRTYLLGAAVSMMADNIEHVISYWIIFQKFQSPALAGFAVLSHWLPFLLFAVYSGALADRFDPRRIIQCAMGLFMFVSLAWGVLFWTDSLQQWHAGVLLVLHGLAGVLWGPAAQLLVHDIVGREHLQSAIRLSSTSRQLGVLMGPAIGGGLLFLFGPTAGILINALFYLPLIIWLWKAPYGPKFREGEPETPRRAMRGFQDIVSTIRSIASNPTIVSMVLLAGFASMFVGNSHQSQMPEFAHDLGEHGTGLQYSILLAGNAGGALIAGIILESRGLLQPKPMTAILLVILWCFAVAGFAMTGSYPVAVALLFVSGFLNLSYNSMAQTLVQLNAPQEIRGRVIGLYNMSGNGMKAFSGVTVGFGGALIGIHWSLFASAMALLAVMVGLLSLTVWTRARQPAG